MCVWIAIVVVSYLAIKWLFLQPRVSKYGDKYVFITGCDSGFGNLLAKELDKLGFKVFAGCLTEKGETDLTKACSKNLTTIPLDVTKEESVATAVHQVEQSLHKEKGLWAVVNNAGIGSPVFPVEWLNKEDYEKTLAVNLYGVIYVTKAVLHLIRREKGRVVNMCSITGRFPCVGAPYNISKFGVEAFSDTLRHELYTSGVTVHVIEPGFFYTPLARGFTPEYHKRMTEERQGTLPKDVQEYYDREFITKLGQKTYKRCVTADPNVMKVVDAYVHAVTARYPKARYVVGKDANFYFRLLWNLPEWLSDYIWHKTG